MNESITVYDKIVLDERLFTIDAHNKMFVDALNPANKIPYEAMTRTPKGYQFLYDRHAHNVLPLHSTHPHLLIFIPKDVAHLKWSSCPNILDKYNDISYTNGHGYSLLAGAYSKRLQGQLPVVTIGENKYAVSLEKNALLHTSNLGGWEITRKNIRLPELATIEEQNGKLHIGFFSKNAHELIKPQQDPEVSASGLNYFRVPELKTLDPIGQALLEGKAAYQYLNRYPARQEQALMQLEMKIPPPDLNLKKELAPQYCKPQVYQPIKRMKRKGL